MLILKDSVYELDGIWSQMVPYGSRWTYMLGQEKARSLQKQYKMNNISKSSPKQTKLNLGWAESCVVVAAAVVVVVPVTAYFTIGGVPLLRRRTSIYVITKGG